MQQSGMTNRVLSCSQRGDWQEWIRGSEHQRNIHAKPWHGTGCWQFHRAFTELSTSQHQSSCGSVVEPGFLANFHFLYLYRCSPFSLCTFFPQNFKRAKFLCLWGRQDIKLLVNTSTVAALYACELWCICKPSTTHHTPMLWAYLLLSKRTTSSVKGWAVLQLSAQVTAGHKHAVVLSFALVQTIHNF